ncbi:MAG: YceI family protein [Deltaproteobacteria bacterium]|jgi:polyisoprenoid-binding protein YceI|nr:YceI family protein [Deltaproteobacteria bacterium]
MSSNDIHHSIRISPIVRVIGIFLLLKLTALAASEPEQLIVFVQPGVSPVDSAFQNERLADIRKLADQMGVRVHMVDATKGAPEEIALTPLLVYQNYRGRSIYQGRTNTAKRIQNFIRTSRYVPQGRALNRREQIPVWHNGRTQTWAPVKVSGVTGTPPADYKHDEFIADALKHIKKGFKKFRMQKSAELNRADRGFYMDFYPWLSDDGTLFLTVAVFSQFYCHAPVIQEKIIGPWKDRKKLFRKAGQLAEQTVARIISNPQSGDSFDPIKKNILKISWEKLGFELPPAPAKKAAVTGAQLKLPREWVLTPSGPADPPMIQFRFPAPLDNYAGEVTSGKGEFIFPANLHPNGATGYIEVDTGNSITMGDPVLDEAIRGSIMLNTKVHPTSKFIIESVASEERPIAFGQQTAAQIRGQFTLKGKTVPLTSMAEIEPIIADDGKPNLLIRSTFEIDLRTFKIEGADGPAPARHTLLFDANFRLKGK